MCILSLTHPQYFITKHLFNIITAILPTPPDAPVTITFSTFSPSKSSSLAVLVVKEHDKAVSPAVPKIIACFDVSSLGFFTKKSPLTFAY